MSRSNVGVGGGGGGGGLFSGAAGLFGGAVGGGGAGFGGSDGGDGIFGGVLSASNGTILGNGSGGIDLELLSSRSPASPPSPLPRETPKKEKPPSDPTAMLRQLLEVNRSLRDETDDGDAEIRMLQHAVVLLSTPDWARDEWLWFVRVGDARTLWEVWCRAHALNRVQQQSADAVAAAEAAAWRSRLSCGMSSDSYFRHGGRFVVDDKAAAAAAVPPMGAPSTPVKPSSGPSGMSALWSSWRGSHGLGVDETKAVSADTRRQAALEHDEDWFIHWTNRVFEI